jgi:HK97 family phage prohead protease
MSYHIKNNGLEVKTKDDKNILGEDFSVEIKELDIKSRTFIAIGSTENPDRSNDIVRVDGWDLKRYKKAPRGLWAHDYRSIPIFKSQKTWIDKEKKQLLFQPEFDVHDQANIIFNQYQNGFLSDFSVGFIAEEHKFRDENQMWNGGIEFTKQQLLEISSVPVPDNPEAQKLGLVDSNINNLIKLGYKSIFDFDEQKGLFWNPINFNLEAYKEPKLVSVGNGIKAVNALPIFKENGQLEVVGYYFDSTNFDKEKIGNWIKKNAPVEPKYFYYNLEENEENENINLKLLSTSDIPPNNSDVSEDVLTICTYCESNLNEEGICPKCNKGECLGCSKPVKECSCGSDNKPKEVFSFTVKYFDSEGNEIKSEELLQNFDKENSNSVKVLIESLKLELEVMKNSILEIKEKIVNLDISSKKDEDLINLDSIEFTPVSQKDQDLIQFDINSLEEITKKVSDDVISGELIDETFNKIFETLLNED